MFRQMLFAVVVANVKAVTPIAKVLQLMEEMLSQGVAAKEAEAVKYSAFKQWCGDQTRIKTSEINHGSQEISKLGAEIEKAVAHIRSLSDRIQELDEDIGRWTKDKQSAESVRGLEAADFKTTVADYTESIDALHGAIAVLSQQAYKREQAEEALLQVTSKRMVPVEAKTALASFLEGAAAREAQQPDEMLLRRSPEAYGYEFQSVPIVEMLRKLEGEFSTKKAELLVEEQMAQHTFEQMAQQLTDNVENAGHEVSDKTRARAETEKHKADLEADLAQTTKDKAEDENYLSSMTTLCEQKATDFASRQELRAQEIQALQTAKDIISSKTVAGAGDTLLPSLLARNVSSSILAHLRSHTSSPLQTRVATFLSERADRIGSKLLSDVARQSADGTFDKVKKLIQELIWRLTEEATRETEHKGWCDSELSSNKIARESRGEDVATLSNEIEGYQADIAQLTQDIVDLTAAVKELDEAMAVALQERTSSNAANTQTIKEAKEAQVAVQEAIAVVKEFYLKSSSATAFAQQEPAVDAPETFDGAYKGMMPQGGNVVDFLEVIFSDFARLESETAAAEDAELAEHKKFMFESEKDKALKEGEITHKSNVKTDKESALHAADAELKLAQEQLEKANAYYEKLKPTCVDAGITYEERVKRREEEIQSLEEALKILQGQDLPTMA